MNPVALALSNADTLCSHPMCLGETLSFRSMALDAYPLGRLHLGLLIRHDDVLFW